MATRGAIAGATHSLTFAVAVAAALGLAAPRFRLARVRTFVIAGVVLASHGLLDTLTDGGLGAALLWPFDLTRYFAPWRPIPVAPIGLDFLSRYGLAVSLAELVLFAPVVVFALGLTRITKYLLPVWIVSVWLLVSGDPVRESVIGIVLRDDTEYASGFSDRSFRAVRIGDADTEVRRLMGTPLGEWWVYRPGGADGCPVVYFDAGVVTAKRLVEACSRLGVRPGSRGRCAACARRPGRRVLAVHSKPGLAHYRVRVVCVSDGKVVEVFRPVAVNPSSLLAGSGVRFGGASP